MDRSSPAAPEIWTWEQRLAHMTWEEQQAALHEQARAELGLEPDDGNFDRDGQREYLGAARVDGNPPGPRFVNL